MTESERRLSAGPSDPAERIGKYDVVRCLGKGAMGVVYLARDPFLERDVALKVMLPQIADDPEQKHRFEREARAVARMMHPNVVTIFDLGYHVDGSPYIAMELLKGQDLLQAMRDGPPFALERTLSIILQVLDGLGHAHQAGIVHRDIKPANTFLNQDGSVKIMDFGVARFTAASMTATGIVVGTANYMAPEQVNGARVDGRADLFSVGCLLYELLVGRRPFEADTLMSTLWKIVHEEPALELPPGAEWSGLVPILRRTLAKQPEDRYQTAADLASALRAFEKQLGAPVPAPAWPPPGDVAVQGSPTLDLKRGLIAPAPPLHAEPRALVDPTPLFRLMREIQVGARSGHLHFASGQGRSSLRILRGGIVHATSDTAGQHLGDILVRYGLLSRTALESALVEVLNERKRLGPVLAERGLMSSQGLGEAIGIHIREILSDNAGRSEGRFAFEELAHDSLSDVEATPTFSIGESILETARRIQSPEVLRSVQGDLDRILSLSTQPLLRAQKLALTPTEGFLLSRIDGATTARDVFGLIPLPLEDVERSLFCLLCTGAVEFVEPGTRPAARPAEAARTPAPRDTSATQKRLREATRAAEEKAALAARQAEESRRREILSAFEGLESRNHYELLGVQRGSTAAEVEAAYERLAAMFRPDLTLPPALADLHDKRAAVYAKLRDARAILGDPGRRARYQAFLDAREMRSQIQPPAPPLPPEAASLHVEGAREATCVNAALREAHRLLQDEKAWDAIQLLEPLVAKAEGHGRLRVQVTLARAYLRNPKWVKRAEELLHQVVQDAPEHAEAYVVLGNIYRAGQLKARALAMYRRALSLQAGLAEAIEGLAALEPPPEPSEGGSLIKKLFRKGS